MSYQAPQPESHLKALAKAYEVLCALHDHGVEAVVTGSLAKGTYQSGSDIDFLVLSCPKSLKYKIESLIEDVLQSSHFDLVYREDARESVIKSMQMKTLSRSQMQAL